MARLLKRHLEYLLTCLRHHITSAVTERLNSKIRCIKSAARSFRNFQNHRISILFFFAENSIAARYDPGRNENSSNHLDIVR